MTNKTEKEIKELKSIVEIKATYFHNENSHPANSYAYRSRYECEKDNWSMVVNHHHVKDGERVLTSR